MHSVGYVEFKDEESVAKALELTGQKLKGVPIIAQLTEAEKNRAARPLREKPPLVPMAPPSIVSMLVTFTLV